MRTIIAALLAALLLPVLPTPARAATSSTSLADWIMSARLEDGAITAHTDRRLVWPYLSNQAAMGLAQTTARTGQLRYARAAWAWLDWYAAHQDDQGFVTDYEVVDGVAVSTGDMDSTDAYAGTFLLAVEHTFEATRDHGRLRRLAPAVAAAVDAIEATQDGDGLTWATPDWHVKYLMDQAETYAGLRAAERLGRILDDPALSQRATRDADALQAGVDDLYDHDRGAYDWAVHEDGVRVPTAWDRLYPDALQQVWAVAYGLVPEARAGTIMRRFLDHHPTWDEPTSMAQIEGRRRFTGYWTTVAWALSHVGMGDLADTGGQRILQAANDADRGWPFTTADAGHLLVLEAEEAPPRTEVHRIAGADRISTAMAVATRHWDRATNVVLAGAHRFPDALAAGGLAARLEAPLLLSPTDRVPDALLTTLRQLRTRRVTIVGGPTAISTEAADQLHAAGLQVERLAGPDRYATSAAVMLEMVARGVAEVVLASGQGFADALAAGALNLDAPVPMLLADGGLSESAVRALRTVRPGSATVLGGPVAMAPAVDDQLADLGLTVDRIAGATRYETATAAAREALARRDDAGPVPVVVASGGGYADALAAAAVVARDGALLLLTPPDDLTSAPGVRTLLRELRGRVSSVTVIGGEVAVSARVRAQLQSLLAPTSG